MSEKPVLAKLIDTTTCIGCHSWLSPCGFPNAFPPGRLSGSYPSRTPASLPYQWFRVVPQAAVYLHLGYRRARSHVLCAQLLAGILFSPTCRGLMQTLSYHDSVPAGLFGSPPSRGCPERSNPAAAAGSHPPRAQRKHRAQSQ